jgi:hypothetical protein
MCECTGNTYPPVLQPPTIHSKTIYTKKLVSQYCTYIHILTAYTESNSKIIGRKRVKKLRFSNLYYYSSLIEYHDTCGMVE